MTKFAECLERELEIQNKRKADIVKNCEIADSTVRSWWAKDAIPSADVALKVAKFLNVSVEYLIDGKEYKPTTDVCIQKIIELLKDFEQKDKCRVLQLVSLFQQLKELDKKLYIEMGELLLRVKSG